MKLNTLSKVFATKGSFNLSYNVATALLLGSLASLAIAVGTGYRLAYGKLNQLQVNPVAQCQQSLAMDNPQAQFQGSHCAHDLEVLTQHIGRIEANLMRINALGERLVETAHLDANEFNFSHEPAMGGPLLEEAGKDTLRATLTELEGVLEKRYTQMSALHLALQTRAGQKDLLLTGLGKPVKEGWISSFFGTRHDPLTGRRAWHAGVDIVGKEGSEVKALAGGVVSFAEVKGGYGHLVEIKHTGGLSTRYGHNKEILVRPGQLVKKGQTIALLGSSGRSTGPHVHLEVHRNGEAVDPGQYFPDLRRNK
jgi:murein DD-endopeptidase MepM/ murein hydrolase activator NlpD